MELERRIGTVLCGKWTLERLLGSGGMAAVYVGVHKIGRRDAIKILHPEIARETELRARFDQEARAVNRFVHPGAVEIRDIDVTDDGCPFLVMELLQGESLSARCNRVGPPDTAEVLRITDELLDVLVAAHAQGIIHRDIKPDNLFCVSDGRLKVLDFGVAHVRQAANSLRTRTGTTLGTVAYMPPEQVTGMPIDVRADVFAVGATMFRLIAKRRIHEARSDAELVIKMGTMPAPSLASVAPEAPAGVCAIVDRALSFDREGRYPSAAAMQEDVRAVRAGRAPLPRPAPQRDAPTRAEKVLVAPSVAATPPLEPARTRLGTRLATMWTVTSVRGKRLRLAALAFPLVGAAVLALVFYVTTRVDQDETREPASTASAPTKALPTATPPPVSEREPTPAPVTEPVSRPSSRPNCFLNNECQYVCDSECDVACTSRNGCAIGVVHDASARCAGPDRCEFSCAGKCEVKCDRAPCLVHCTPGFECEIDDCRKRVEECSPLLFACGTPCPE